jgi:hypothetical protein
MIFHDKEVQKRRSPKRIFPEVVKLVPSSIFLIANKTQWIEIIYFCYALNDGFPSKSKKSLF